MSLSATPRVLVVCCMLVACCAVAAAKHTIKDELWKSEYKRHESHVTHVCAHQIFMIEIVI